MNTAVRETIVERQVHFQSSDCKWTCLLWMFCVYKHVHTELPALLAFSEKAAVSNENTRLSSRPYGTRVCREHMRHPGLKLNIPP